MFLGLICIKYNVDCILFLSLYSVVCSLWTVVIRLYNFNRKDSPPIPELKPMLYSETSPPSGRQVQDDVK